MYASVNEKLQPKDGKQYPKPCELFDVWLGAGGEAAKACRKHHAKPHCDSGTNLSCTLPMNEFPESSRFAAIPDELVDLMIMQSDYSSFSQELRGNRSNETKAVLELNKGYFWRQLIEPNLDPKCKKDSQCQNLPEIETYPLVFDMVQNLY